MKKGSNFLKKLVILKPAHAGNTARQCSAPNCKTDFEYFKYGVDAQGRIDKSSRRPVCEEHKGAE